MVPLIGLAGLAIQAAPTIARWIGGAEAEEVTKRVSDVAQSLFGTTDADQIEGAIAKDPAAALQFKLALANIAAEKERQAHEEMLARIADVANARQMQIETRSSFPHVLGYVITAGFFGILGYMMIFGVTLGQGGSEALMIMLGSLAAAFGGLVAWTYGSTARNMLKDITIDRLSKG